MDTLDERHSLSPELRSDPFLVLQRRHIRSMDPGKRATCQKALGPDDSLQNHDVHDAR